MAVTGSRVALPCYHVSLAGTLATLSSPTDAVDPVHHTTLAVDNKSMDIKHRVNLDLLCSDNVTVMIEFCK